MSDISKFQVKSVIYSAKDTQARETAEEALQKAETNENSITTLETSVQTAINTAENASTIATSAQASANVAQTSAEKAQASADEKQPFISKTGISIYIPEESDKTFTDKEMSELLGVEFQSLKQGDSFIILSTQEVYGNASSLVIGLYTWNGTNWTVSDGAGDIYIETDNTGHFMLSNPSANNPRLANILCFPTK